jgi:hypothetical protein
MRYLAAVCALGSTVVCAAQPLAPVDDTAIRDLESKSWVAWKAQDATFFEQFLSDDHLEVHGYGITTKANVVDAVRRASCVVRTYSLGPLTLTLVTPDSVLVSYRAEQDTRCGSVKVPSPVWATSLYVNRSGKWVNVLYQQTPAL